MIKKFFAFAFLVLSMTFTVPALAQTQKKPIQYTTVTALQIVDKPSAYMNKFVKINAVFNKFSTLGLDYKPALKSSKDYISFLVKRENITDHTVPLSELKIFIKRKSAEKLIDLESGDKIEIKGKIFSNALGDAWLEAYEVKIMEPKPAKK